ncbi:MAG: prenyltransferase/squalene oxidase repeat-containing protein, partial [Planctomycetota bacterium]
VGKGGGSKGSESAVDAALRWFKKHQSANGMWDARDYFQNCTEDPKCEPGSLGAHGAEAVNTAMTGYALLCFLGAGHDHKALGKYKTVVKKGLDYLISIQKPNGYMGAQNYEHPVATMALAEAYAMTSDPDLKGPAQKAVDQVLEHQNIDPKAPDKEYAGLGWNYGPPVDRNDASVTGWNVMALKSAFAAGLTVKNGMEGAKRWLELSWKANNDGQGGRPDWKKLDIYKDESLFSYAWYPDLTTYSQERMRHQNIESVGLVCAVFLGHRSGDVMLETLANYVANRQTPKSFSTNIYYMYYNTMGMYQVGGDRWKVWNTTVRDMLVDAQRKGEGCFDGSWDWQNAKFTGHDVGRVLSTAYCCLSLEVYYRYAQVNQPGAAKH